MNSLVTRVQSRALESLEPTQARRDVDVRLPTRGRDWTTISDGTSGLGLRFRSELQSPSALPIAYGASTGLSCDQPGCAPVLLRPIPGGVEDYALIERTSTTQVIYALELQHVGGLRLVANALELLDDTGVPRVRMAPPFVIDNYGIRVPAEVRVEGCDVDNSSAVPFGRPTVALASHQCQLVVSWPEGLAYPVLLDPTWQVTSSMIEPRVGHSLVRLPDGRILAAGGGPGDARTLVTEVFDPVSGTWSVTGSLPAARYYAALAVWGSEKVVLAGGFTDNQQPGDSYVYDVSSGEWTGGPPRIDRVPVNLSAATLDDGSAIFGGGCWISVAQTDICLGASSVVRLAVGAGDWEYLDPPEAQYGSTFVKLSGDRFALVSGFHEPDLTNTQVYEQGEWRQLETTPSRGLGAVLELPGDRLLVAGGWPTLQSAFDGAPSLSSVVLFDLKTGVAQTRDSGVGDGAGSSQLFLLGSEVLWTGETQVASSLLAGLPSFTVLNPAPTGRLTRAVQASPTLVVGTMADATTVLFSATGGVGADGGTGGEANSAGAGGHPACGGDACADSQSDGGCSCSTTMKDSPTSVVSGVGLLLLVMFRRKKWLAHGQRFSRYPRF